MSNFNPFVILIQNSDRQRIANILIYGYFGDCKDLDHDISELRWKNGRRIYYAYVKELDIILLLGGNKNGQNQDIKQAKNIYKKYLQRQTQS